MRTKFQSLSRLDLEPLEDRVLLSVSSLNALLPGSDSSGAALVAAAHKTPDNSSIVGNLSQVTPLQVSGVPANGDQNPYGLAFVPKGFASGGPLSPGDLLVADFNNSMNLQGTGSTILSVAPDGTTSVFFQGPTGLGLTTALGILKQGFIIVGSMPTTDGTSATAQPGALLIINKNGAQVASISNASIDGPWDLTVDDDGSHAAVFVSNVLNGTVTRINLQVNPNGVTVQNMTQIASGYTHRGDPAALELGPTGLAFDDQTGNLYVASTLDNTIYVIHNAERRQSDGGPGKVIFDNSNFLHGPLGLVLTPDGNLIVANGDAINADPTQPSELVEITTHGKFISEFSIDSNEDAPFGIAINSNDGTIQFAAVDDNNNMINLWTIPQVHHHGHGH